MKPSNSMTRRPVAENGVLLHDPSRGCWLSFDHPVRVWAIHSLADVVPALADVEQRVNREHLHAAGFIAYEAAPAFDPALTTRKPGSFPLLWFGLYRAPRVLTTLPKAGPVSREPAWKPSIPAKRYAQDVRTIRALIRAGETYQVNYSFRLRARLQANPWSLFTQMIQAQGPGYGAFIRAGRWTVCSASPESFFTLRGTRLASRPMKGTAPRGLGTEADRQQADHLYHSEKNRAENIMIVDMVRNDLGRVADTGSVKVTRTFDVEPYPTLWQMTSTVECRSRASVTHILAALFPAASITGAPKARTMEIISRLERSPRLLYTGTIGYLAPGRRAQFNVAIRTVLVDTPAGRAEFGVGGGIVWDSTERGEFEECATKARVLTHSPPDFELLETLLWTPRTGYAMRTGHLERLAASASYFNRPLDLSRVRACLRDLAHRLPRTPHRVRLLLDSTGKVRVEFAGLIPLSAPYRLRLARTPIKREDPFLYHKTTNRTVYDSARKGVPDCDDVLLWNEQGEITETTIANVAVEQNGRLVTPPIRCGLLPGVYRARLLAQGRLEERPVRIEELQHRPRIFLMNAVRGIWPAVFQVQ